MKKKKVLEKELKKLNKKFTKADKTVDDAGEFKFFSDTTRSSTTDR